MFKPKYVLSLLTSVIVMSCATTETAETSSKIKLITLDPGHFHSALVQKSMYDTVDSTVHIYAPESPDVNMHLDKINSYNARPESPTNWNSVVYKGDDFFEKMLAEKAGNVVMLAGNNKKKTEYISESINNGFNVFADKPMVINTAGFELLKSTFKTAKEKDLLVYDIMTERFEISTMLQKALSQIPSVFGELEKGTIENPAVTKESVHHFFKYVSGSPLTRPAWFFDVAQEGEGIVDVTTHLVDLVQWECFPEQIIDTNAISILEAKRWPTVLSKDDFQKVTKLEEYPDYLSPYIADDKLSSYSNGEINYTINGVHAKVSVIWNYKAPEGAGDTHYSIMRGTKANLIIRQGEEQGFKPTLYIQTLGETTEADLTTAFEALDKTFPGVSFEKQGDEYIVLIPDHYKEGHEAHFSRVTEKYLEYLQNRNMPAWEVPNMITKYYTTTKALEMALKN
ncbi:putative oxidoreductase C-terminal domain-containing protein [Arcticibacterium luteifluviistationis]|uniref:Oxidoreductase n=1 Tax=Arcticibacterium luteifluviistationis TaxID=1784714 RepID=A0A2Z4GF04_9BACT|nr:putative oxidoreductase C-terminal domain-containing protein [Arcticibacterium luteifluviistationis]AWV99741.1 oxidoreductase [Arcticibacterium luteifluviistationis]